MGSAEIVDGGTYTLKIGTEETQITMDGLIYGSGHEMGGGRGNMKGGADQTPHRGGRQNGEMPPNGEIPPNGEKPDAEMPNEKDFGGEKPNRENFNGQRPDRDHSENAVDI